MAISIHEQLKEFEVYKVFRYKYYLFRLILYFNYSGFQHLGFRRMDNRGEVILVAQWTNIFNYKERSLNKFVDKFISYRHKMFFGKKLNRMPEDLRKFL